MRFMTAQLLARYSEWLETELPQYGMSPRDAHAVAQASEKQLAAMVPMSIEEENAAALTQCRNFIAAVHEFESGKKQPKGAI
jgi:hypothetical protein